MAVTLIDVLGEIGDHFVKKLYEASIDVVLLGREGPFLTECEDVLIVVQTCVLSDVLFLEKMPYPLVPRCFEGLQHLRLCRLFTDRMVDRMVSHQFQVPQTPVIAKCSCEVVGSCIFIAKLA